MSNLLSLVSRTQKSCKGQVSVKSRYAIEISIWLHAFLYAFSIRLVNSAQDAPVQKAFAGASQRIPAHVTKKRSFWDLDWLEFSASLQRSIICSRRVVLIRAWHWRKPRFGMRHFRWRLVVTEHHTLIPDASYFHFVKQLLCLELIYFLHSETVVIFGLVLVCHLGRTRFDISQLLHKNETVIHVDLGYARKVCLHL